MIIPSDYYGKCVNQTGAKSLKKGILGSMGFQGNLN